MLVILHTMFSFPAVVYTVLLIICLLYWLTAFLGIFDFDMGLDLDIPDSGASDLSGSGDSHSLGGISALLFKLKLDGVPLTLTITFIALFGWLFAFNISFLFMINSMETVYRYLFGVPIVLGSLFAAVLITAIVIKPFKPLFSLNDDAHRAKALIGRVAEVRSSVVTTDKGEANYENGAAGLILQVRSANENEQFKRGDHVVIIEYLPELNIYKVISEEEFNRL